MATGKRYYWIKLKESFMTSDTIDYFMEQPDGANYVVLYQLLCLKTINTGGRLSRQIGEITIPYDVAKIQRDCKWFSADTIRVALNLYLSVGLIYEDVDGTLVLTDHKNLVGSETDYAAQKKNQRKSPPQLPPLGVDIVHSDVHENVHTDIDIRDREKRLEKELEIDIGTKELSAHAGIAAIKGAVYQPQRSRRVDAASSIFSTAIGKRAVRNIDRAERVNGAAAFRRSPCHKDTVIRVDCGIGSRIDVTAFFCAAFLEVAV